MTITLTVGDNTYVSLEDANAYFTKYGNTDWAGDDELLKQALILGTQAVDLNYGDRFQSQIASSSQSLLFPRTAFYDADGRYQTGIPTALKNAVCELALLQLGGTNIFPSENNSGAVDSESFTVGGISQSTTYRKVLASERYEGFRKVEIALRPLMKTVSANWSLRA